MNYLLDTCVLSEFTRRQPEGKVIRWLEQLEEEKLFVSAITIGEIQRGVQRMPDSNRKADLLLWINNSLIQRFEQRVLPLDLAAMLLWGSMSASMERSGRPMGLMDSLIAATAIQHNLILVTRNVKDFSSCGLETANPWG